MKKCLSILLVVLGAAGCDLSRLSEFRGQLRDLSHHTHWEKREGGEALVFSRPVLLMEDLSALGIYPVEQSPGRLTVGYHYHGPDATAGLATEAVLLIEHRRLAGIIFPLNFVQFLGRENVEALLQMAGGASDATLKAIPQSRLDTLLPDIPARDPSNRLSFRYVPVDGSNRMLIVSMEAGRRKGLYEKFSFDFRRQKPGDLN
jgi:hypothetical protein